jgi:hypothetical protein
MVDNANSAKTAVREHARQLIEVLDEIGDDVLSKEKEIIAIMQSLLGVPGLDTVLANPSAAAAGGPFSTGWIYYDCDLRITRGIIDAGFVQRPHNHGTWNILGVYRGAMHYRSYERLDDRSRPFFADLAVAEDRIMTDGDVTVLPGPPHDIHTNAALAPGTVTLLVSRDEFSATREQYLPDLRSYYLVDAERAAR